MRILVGLVIVTLTLGCRSKHELVVYNRSDEELGNLEVVLGEERLPVGSILNDRVRRVTWRGPSDEGGYEFWEGTGAVAERIGSCGYASNPMPGAVIAYLIVFRPDGSIHCRWIPPE